MALIGSKRYGPILHMILGIGQYYVTIIITYSIPALSHISILNFSSLTPIVHNQA